MPLNESSSNTTVQYTITTTNTADGTVLYWKTTGNTTNSDIVNGNTGTITITNNRALLNVTMNADSTTEGTKTLGISISTGSLTGPVAVNTANFIEVQDTSVTPAPFNITFLAVAGGGGGGVSGGVYGAGCGGGAGGLVLGSFSTRTGNVVTITVGAGGSGGPWPSPVSTEKRGAVGSNTSLSGPWFSTVTALGGGGGGQGGPTGSPGFPQYHSGGSGGSGGGGHPGGGTGLQPSQNPGNPIVTNQYGNSGGNSGGGSGGAGGGGAGGVGTTPAVPSLGGGAGYSWPVNSLTYGLGGNGPSAPSWSVNDYPGIDGTAGRGDGGSGSSPNRSGGSGGSGTIILVIPTVYYPGSAPGSASITTSGSNTIITYTSSGTYTA